MKTSRVKLEEKITKKLKDKLGMTPTYFTQGSGSSKMKTLIIKSDGTCDADRGIYLPSKPDVEAKTVQEYVYDAVKDHTADGAEHRKKCIRVLYKAAYNIDFPVYYEVENETYSYIAIKDIGWEKDDPSKMIDWFIEFKDDDCQLLREIKYLKAWASECSFKMPSGIALTVWAARCFSYIEDRDDKCLLQILEGIQRACFGSVSCPSPVEPFDDLVAKLNDSQKNKFKSELDAFCSDAKKAVNSNNQLEASKIWRQYLGDRFQEGLDEDVDKKANALRASAASILGGKAFLNTEGKINETFGTHHQSHRNYGG